MIELPRRRFITGLASLIAAPAVVRAASIMPVRGWLRSDCIPVKLADAEYWFLDNPTNLRVHEAAIRDTLMLQHSFSETLLKIRTILPEEFYVSHGA